MTRSEETVAVKKALKEADIPCVYVRHGRGTARWWLKINLGPDPERGLGYCEEQKKEFSPEWQHYQRRALNIAQEVTGRDGEDDGKILILTQ